MFRFLAIVWDHTNQSQSEQAAHLSRRLEVQYGPAGGVCRLDGLAVHWADARAGANEPYVLPAQNGVLLGKLFERRPPAEAQPPAKFDHFASSVIRATGGRALIDNYWGRYVAFLYDAESGGTKVLRDPTATLPCFTTSTHGVRLFFSYIDDCIDLGISFSIDWNRLSSHLVSAANERSAVTAISEVLPVHAGECVTCTGGNVRREFYWDPYTVASSNPIEDPVAAASEMRDTVRSCIQAWASCYGGILLRLSGGLDSSIVAQCLRDTVSDPEVTCFTHHSPGADADERIFARASANKAGYRLIEHPRTDDVRLDYLQNMVRHPHPFYARYAIEYSRLEARLAHAHNAGAIFSGEWGDALFYISNDMHPAIDRAWLHGLKPGLFKAALDTARREGHLVWKVLGHAFKEGRARRPQPDPWTGRMIRHRALLNPDLHHLAGDSHPFRHPWRAYRDGTPPGKFMHIFDSALHDYQPFYDPLGTPSDADQVAPLHSQPILELCLRIPTYLHTAGGWDRAIARRAFLQDVPRSNITRRTKGAADGHLKAVITNNIDFVRETLLDGQLVQRGFVDKRQLHEVLSGGPTRIVTALPELYWYLCTEMFISGFADTRHRLAA